VIPSAEELTARLAMLQRRLVAMLRGRAVAARQRVEQLARSRILRNPKALIFDLAHRLDELDQQALRAVGRRLTRSRDQVQAITCRLDALSPLAVLARGYSMTTRAADGQLLRSAAELSIGDRMLTRLAQGQVQSRVEVLDEQ
jgi:exodeoxyribonuclease VII large subunit